MGTFFYANLYIYIICKKHYGRNCLSILLWYLVNEKETKFLENYVVASIQEHLEVELQEIHVIRNAYNLKESTKPCKQFQFL